MNTRRRLFVALGASALFAAFNSFAQQQGKIWRIAMIRPGSAGTSEINLSAFRDGMRDHGMLEGKHYILDVVDAEGYYDRFPTLTSKVLERNPAIIMVQTIESVRVAQQATKTIPIVFVSTNDPVGSGLVASLARPGGNTTGLSTQNEDVVSKYVELLRELLPRAKQVAVLINARNPTGRSMFERVRVLAGGFGIAAKAFEATSPESFEDVFRSISMYKPDALLIPADVAVYAQRDLISEFGLKNRIPVIVSSVPIVASGALVSYGPSTPDMFRRAATYVKKILAGANPGDLPVEQPVRFELAINGKTAKALGVKIPQSILISADKVIE